MCQIYSSAEPARYESEARSLRIQGCVTSVRLENEFWKIEVLSAGDMTQYARFVDVPPGSSI